MKSVTKESILTNYTNTLESILSPNSKNMPKKEDKSINELFEGKFYCARTFTEEIERIVQENKGMKYVDAIVFFCEKNNVEVESVPKLVSKPLKEKLKCEAMELNLLKRTSHAKLPI